MKKSNKVPLRMVDMRISIKDDAEVAVGSAVDMSTQIRASREVRSKDRQAVPANAVVTSGDILNVLMAATATVVNRETEDLAEACVLASALMRSLTEELINQYSKVGSSAALSNEENKRLPDLTPEQEEALQLTLSTPGFKVPTGN